jgi:3-oxoacyl-[acyl-carrier-protein] synthase II
MISDIASGQISIKHGLRGPNYCTVAACASSTVSLINGFDHIRLGRADIIIAGGSEAPVTTAGLAGFNALHALSTRNHDPKTASRPFDLDRDGFVMGEGGGALILEEYEHAVKRGAKIYCELVGGGLSADAYHLTAPHPEGLGAALVMRNALNDAGLNPEAIDYINVHGTSTPLGDVAEPLAVLSVFGEHSYNLSISATKSMHGHLLGAAGAVEAIACILAIQESKIPPTINHFTDDPQFDPRLDFTFNTAKDREVRYALSNTFGFGGHNATVIFKKMDA